MCICKLCHKSTVDHLVLIRIRCFCCGKLHALDTVNLGFACNLHIKYTAAFAGRNIVHTPGQFLARLGNQKPSHKLFPFYREGGLGICFNFVFGNKFGQLFHSAFSFRYFGVIWIFDFEVLFCRMKSAFYSSDRNVQLFGNFGLRKLFPKIKIQDLLVFIAK